MEIILLFLNTLILLLEGASDKKIRGIPLVVVAVHGALAAFSAVYYLLIEPRAVIIALVTAGSMALLLAILRLWTGMIGGGDVLIPAISLVASPFPVAGCLRYAPVLTPAAMIASSAYLLYWYRRSTPVVYVKGYGPIRAVVRYAIQFKRGEVSDSPVYIEGVGAVGKELRNNPEKLRELVSRLDDYTPIYVVPNYPYIYYYSLAYLITTILLNILSVGLSVVGVCPLPH